MVANEMADGNAKTAKAQVLLLPRCPQKDRRVVLGCFCWIFAAFPRLGARLTRDYAAPVAMSDADFQEPVVAGTRGRGGEKKRVVLSAQIEVRAGVDACWTKDVSFTTEPPVNARNQEGWW